MRCSQTQGQAKRRMDGEQGGPAPKKPRRGEEPSRDPGLEECKVQVLEAITFGLDRMTLVLERVEDEVWLCGDLAALHAFKEARFPISEWDRWERFANFIVKEDIQSHQIYVHVGYSVYIL